MKLAIEPYQKILTGQKIIEARLYDEKRRKINIGDLIEFSQKDDQTKKITIKVKALHRYATFKELFFDFPPANFGGESLERLLKEIRQFYSPDEESKLGVIGIRIEIEKN